MNQALFDWPAQEVVTPDPPSLTNLISGRRSTRAFTKADVPISQVTEILRLAACAPSGGNLQPWQVKLLTRPAIAQVKDAVLGTGVPASKANWDEYRYYPSRFFGVYDERRKALGRALYGLLGIERRDVKAMRAQFDRNFDFFGAPVGLLITIDRGLEKGSWIDLGMFMQNICLAAAEQGLGTCVQAAFAPYHKVIRPITGMADEEVLVCGIALGHCAEEQTVNQLRTERAAHEEWLQII